MKKLVSILIAMSFIYSCSRISEEDLWISADQEYKQHNYMSAIAKYQEIVEKFKNNPRADSAQYLIASIYNNELQEYRNAISEYRKLVKLFPNSQKSPKVMFLIGFIYNNQLNEYDSARIAYEEFIEKYGDKIDWLCITSYQKLSDEFIMKHLNKIRIHYLINNDNIKLSNFTKLRLAMKYPEYKEDIMKIKESI